MQQYIKDALKSRGFDEHNIKSSFRGRRKASSDGREVCFVCRECHNEIHRYNNHNTRQFLLNRVEEILKTKKNKGK